jgi:phosphatidylserine decarboxylase
MLKKLFVLLQFVWPQHWITAMVWRIARIRHSGTKDYLITQFVRLYNVNIDEALLNVPEDFATFNDFFIRELKHDARRIDSAVDSIVSPVDGTISNAGNIHAGSIIQAKGMDYSLEDLLATDLDDARTYEEGCFATIYLAPYNYHRVHMPFDGKLFKARYVPGDLFSVNEATVAGVRGLFRRNERLIMHFETAHGTAVLIFVGALNVGSISTPWSGELRPRKRGVVDALDITSHATGVQKGELLGWFNMGSTVIMLLPENSCSWGDALKPGATLRMGEAIGKFQAAE